MKFFCVLLIFLGATVLASLAAPMPLGKTVKFTLEKGAQGELDVSLPEGNYLALLDGRLASGRKGFLDLRVELANDGGAVLNPQFLKLDNIYRPADRMTKGFEMKRTMQLRFRVRNEGETADVWLTVQARGTTFLPYPYSAELRPLSVGAAGNRGTLDFDRTAYFAVTVPAGKWDLSLTLQAPGAKELQLGAHVDLLDPYGGTLQQGLIAINELGRQASKRHRFEFSRPHTVMLALTSTQVAPQEHLGFQLTLDKGEP